jgi:hypothetical protein
MSTCLGLSNKRSTFFVCGWCCCRCGGEENLCTASACTATAFPWTGRQQLQANQDGCTYTRATKQNQKNTCPRGPSTGVAKRAASVQVEHVCKWRKLGQKLYGADIDSTSAPGPLLRHFRALREVHPVVFGAYVGVGAGRDGRPPSASWPMYGPDPHRPLGSPGLKNPFKKGRHTGKWQVHGGTQGGRSNVLMAIKKGRKDRPYTGAALSF